MAAALSAGCKDDQKTPAKPEATASASAAPKVEAEPPPGPCAAAGTEPVSLGTASGHVHGFGLDAGRVYFSSWQLFGGRGDLGWVRKDGKGKRNLTSLSLEPRSLIVDDAAIFYTTGIRLGRVPKDGGEAKVLVETFSSQSIAGDGTYVYGVPGDYGPYDRLIRAEKSLGKTKELDVSERPESRLAPFGFSAIAVDAEGIYVTDSSADRVLRFPLDRGKPKILAKGQEKAFDLALDDQSVFFTLAKKGLILKVSRSGGTPEKVASGLAPNARIAVSGGKVATTAAALDAKGTETLVLVGTDGSAPTPVATVPRGSSVDAVALDEKCVYWAEHEPGAGTVTFRARAR
jgi:hypothetical protein